LRYSELKVTVVFVAAHPGATCASLLAATMYGPTNGPPSPGSVPAGVTDSVAMSDRARDRFSRPLPVSEAVPARSALRASRPTMTPFEAAASKAASRAAAPATEAAEADVPPMVVYPPPASVVRIETPGAARKTASP
jgi:hypothetical protein